MAYNGSGVFNRLYSWVTDKANGLKIQATRMDAEFDGIATGLSNAICKDGQTTITAAIPFNSQRVTGLGNATADTDALNRVTADGRYTRHGECYLSWTSTTTIRLDPMNGNKLIINGTQYTIPAAGVAYTLTGTAGSTLYYVYAYISGASIALELSTTAYTSDVTTGVMIKIGDGSRTLVGCLYTYGGVNTMANDGAGATLTLLSWFNKKRRTVANGVTGSASYYSQTGLGGALIVTNWAAHSVDWEWVGMGYHNVAGGTHTWVPGLDGATGYTHGINHTSSTATYWGNMSGAYGFNPAEGAHTFQMYGVCNNVGPGSAMWWYFVNSATTLG